VALALGTVSAHGSGMIGNDDDSGVRRGCKSTVTAASLRARATGAGNKKVAVASSRLRDEAVRAADGGFLSFTMTIEKNWFPYEIRDSVKAALEADGFRVSFYDGDMRDHEQSVTVHW
jgi:hypothetical protein